MEAYELKMKQLADEIEPIAEAAYNAYTKGTTGYRPLTWREVSEDTRERFRRVVATVRMAERYGLESAR